MHIHWFVLEARQALFLGNRTDLQKRAACNRFFKPVRFGKYSPVPRHNACRTSKTNHCIIIMTVGRGQEELIGEAGQILFYCT